MKIAYSDLLLSIMELDTTGATILLNLFWSSGRNTWKHNLTVDISKLLSVFALVSAANKTRHAYVSLILNYKNIFEKAPSVLVAMQNSLRKGSIFSSFLFRSDSPMSCLLTHWMPSWGNLHQHTNTLHVYTDALQNIIMRCKKPQNQCKTTNVMVPLGVQLTLTVQTPSEQFAPTRRWGWGLGGLSVFTSDTTTTAFGPV